METSVSSTGTFGKICSKCKKPNHFAAKCQSSTSSSYKIVQAVDDDNFDEVFPTEISALGIDDSQLVTLQLEIGKLPPFSGRHRSAMQCHSTTVIPAGCQGSQTHTCHCHKLKNYCIIWRHHSTGCSTVALKMRRCSIESTLHCKIVDCVNIRTLLGRKSCLLLTYLNNDNQILGTRQCTH